MRINGDHSTSIYLSGPLKQKFKAVAALEGRNMTETGAEAIALYALIDRDIRDELGFDTNGELISAAVDKYIEKRGLDQ